MKNLGIINPKNFKKAPNVWFENGAVYIVTASGRKRLDVQPELIKVEKNQFNGLN